MWYGNGLFRADRCRCDFGFWGWGFVGLDRSQSIEMTYHTQILTLYPEMFPGPLGISLAGRALAEGIWSCEAINIRDFATDKHKSVDDTPAGGGAGMVLRADVLASAVDWVRSQFLPGTGRWPAGSEGSGEASSDAATLRPVSTDPSVTLRAPPPRCGEELPILALTPRGAPITQARVRDLAAGPGVTILCGRFEGFDERLFDARPDIEQVSMGDIVLSGGEVGAMMLLDACIRLLPGVMGAPSSGVEESFESGLLEYPHYTRPATWEGRTIPEVLRSGDHAKIAAWRKHQAEVDTRLRRPDLWECHIGARVQSASDARQENKDHMGHEPHPTD
jgi:tRNA (guanine37-N1)-methyltransferase